MTFYEKILVFIAAWTLIEGGIVLTAPRLALKISRKIFPKWGEFLSEIRPAEFRRLGIVEFTFGLLLGGYLLWSLR